MVRSNDSEQQVSKKSDVKDLTELAALDSNRSGGKTNGKESHRYNGHLDDHQERSREEGAKERRSHLFKGQSMENVHMKDKDKDKENSVSLSHEKKAKHSHTLHPTQKGTY